MKQIATIDFKGGRLNHVKDPKGGPLDVTTLSPFHQEMICRIRTLKLDMDIECYLFDDMEPSTFVWMLRDFCPLRELKRTFLGDI